MALQGSYAYLLTPPTDPPSQQGSLKGSIGCRDMRDLQESGVPS